MNFKPFNKLPNLVDTFDGNKKDFTVSESSAARLFFKACTMLNCMWNRKMC